MAFALFWWLFKGKYDKSVDSETFSMLEVLSPSWDMVLKLPDVFDSLESQFYLFN